MDEVGIPGNQQRLTLDGGILEDDHILDDYNIIKDTVLHLVPLHCGNDMRIHVNTLTGKMITLEVVLEDAIENVKRKLFQEEGIPVECQCLLYGDKELKDYCTLKDYNIKRGSTVLLTKKVLDGMPIFVQMLTGKKMTLNVKPETSVKSVKVEIQKRRGVPPGKQRLYLGDQALKACRTLRDYNIQKESTLCLRVDDHCGSIPVHVLMPTGKMTTLDVSWSDDVQNIKLEIYYKEDIPPDQQCLLLDGEELENSRTLNDLYILKKSMLHLVLHQSVEELYSSAGGSHASKGQLRRTNNDFLLCLRFGVQPVHLISQAKDIGKDFAM